LSQSHNKIYVTMHNKHTLIRMHMKSHKNAHYTLISTLTNHTTNNHIVKGYKKPPWGESRNTTSHLLEAIKIWSNVD